MPQDVYFDIFDVPKKITLAKFGFLTNFVQPRDEKMNISEMGGGDALLFIKNRPCNQFTHIRYQLKADILLFLMTYCLIKSIH